MDTRVTVVAVAAVGDVAAGSGASALGEAGVAVAVAVAIAVPDGRVHRVVLVRAPVAVVVHAVTILGGTRVCAGVTVVTIAAVRAVAAGGRASVGAAAAVTVAVTVGVSVPGGGAHDAGVIVVREPVTVVVGAVAGLGSAGIHRGAAIVTVGVVGHVAAGFLTSGGAAAGVAVAVAIVVCVPGARTRHARIVVVGQAVAVVVIAVADLAGTGVNGGVTVVAVAVIGDVAGGSIARDLAQAAVAVAVAVAVAIPGGGAHCVVLVDGAVAVVVHAVAGLVRVGVDRAITVVTVLARGPTVPVAVGVARGTIAVVVVGIRAVCLGRPRVVVGVCVVAVAAVGRVAAGLLAGNGGVRVVAVAVAVPVSVPGGGVRDVVVLVVHPPITVVIHLVADLLGPWVDVGIGVVAVPLVLRVAVQIVVDGAVGLDRQLGLGRDEVVVAVHDGEGELVGVVDALEQVGGHGEHRRAARDTAGAGLEVETDLAVEVRADADQQVLWSVLGIVHQGLEVKGLVLVALLVAVRMEDLDLRKLLALADGDGDLVRGLLVVGVGCLEPDHVLAQGQIVQHQRHQALVLSQIALVDGAIDAAGPRQVDLLGGRGIVLDRGGEGDGLARIEALAAGGRPDDDVGGLVGPLHDVGLVAAGQRANDTGQEQEATVAAHGEPRNKGGDGAAGW